MVENTENNSALKEVILRSWMDEGFKKDLLSEPLKVLQKFGLASGHKENAPILRVIENTNDEVFLVLPARPKLEGLSDDQIRELVDSVMAVQLVLPTILDTI